MGKCIRSLNKEEMSELAVRLGEKPFRGKQLFQWIHEKRTDSFDSMTNLPGVFRDKLKEEFIIDPFRVERKQVSKDESTAKFLFSLSEGDGIESVWMRYRHGDSVCVSSQLGCRMGCRFCASTIDGLTRNLSSGEMLSQIYDIEREMYGDRPDGGRVSSVIVMGMGEPFDNYDEVIGFIRLLTDEDGRNLGARHITVSTCGLPEGIRKLADEELPVTLALSLHAPDDALRKTLMPVANAYPLSEVLEACREYFDKTGRRVTFEYSMIRGVNDGEEQAEKLGRLCEKLRKKGMPTHVNLIPLNAVSGKDMTRTDEKVIRRFKIILEKYRINVTIRREMGSEIDAACGQLRRKARQRDHFSDN